MRTRTLVVAVFAVLSLLVNAASAQQPRVENAAVQYWQAFAVLGERLTKEDLQKLEALVVEGGAIDAKAAAMLEVAGPALRCLRRGAAMKTCDWGLDFGDGPEMLMPHLAKARQLARIAALRARRSFENGKPADAIDDLAAVMTMARHTSLDGTLIGLLVGVAVETTAIDMAAKHLPKLDAASRDALAARFERLPAAATAADAIRSEKRFFLDWFVAKLEKAKADRDPKILVDILALVDSSDEARKMFGDKDGVDKMLKLCAASRGVYDEVAAAMALPPEKFAAESAAIMKKIEAPEHLLSRMLVPAFVRVRGMEQRHAVRLAMLRAAIDVAGKGADAIKNHKDPFGDGPFLYRKTDGGFEIESKLVHDGAAVKLIVGAGK